MAQQTSKKFAVAALAGLMTVGTLSGCKSMHEKKDANACSGKTTESSVDKSAETSAPAKDANACNGRDKNSCK
jgi:hypothetical protein